MSTQTDHEPSAPSTGELEEKLGAFVGRVAARLQADIVTLYLYDPERDKFYLPVGYGVMDEATFRHAMPRSDRVAGKVVKGRLPVIAEDARAHPDMSGPFTFRERVVSAAGFPIFLGESPAGVLFVSYRSPHRFQVSRPMVEALLQEAAAILADLKLAEVRELVTSGLPGLNAADKNLLFILKSACTFTNLPVGLWVLDRATATLAVRASTGLRQEFVPSAAVRLDACQLFGQVIEAQDQVAIRDIEQDGRFPFPGEVEHEGWKSMLAVPVPAGGHVVGLLAAFAFTVRDFAPWERELLLELAGRIGDALLEEQRSQTLTHLHKIGLALAAKRELPEVLDLIVDSAAKVFGADIVTLYPYDQEHDEFAEGVALGATADFDQHCPPSRTGIAALLARGGKPLFADDAEHDSCMSRGFIVGQRVKSSAGFPLKVGDEVVAVLFINYRAPYRFLQSDQELFALFASQAALAVKNARLFQEERRRVTLAQIATTFSETLDRQKTLQALVKGAQELTGATNCSLFLFNRELDVFELSAQYPPVIRPISSLPRPQGGLTRTILDTGRPILIADARQDARVRSAIVREGVRSILGVPVQVKGERVGVLHVHSNRINHFDRRDIGLLQSLADYGAIAIERTRPLEAITHISEATANILKLDDLVAEMLGRIVNELHFGFAALQLVNYEENTIETVAGVNVPWGAEAKHPLDSDDIQADIVRSRRTEVIAGPDPRFDARLYERFGHERLVRVFIPLVAGDVVFGTVEAGHDRRDKPDLSPGEQAALSELVAQYTPELWKGLLPCVLQVIIANAVGMVRAHSGSIHLLYRRDRRRYVYEACAGRIGPEFLVAFPPGEQGIGHQSLREGRPVWIDDPEELATSHPGIYAPETLWTNTPDKYRQGEGVRAIACCPLVTGGKYEGVLYVHYWAEHTFSEDELGWLQLFADQVAAAIQDAEFYEKLRNRSQALTHLSMIGHSLVSELQLSNLLSMIARGARDVLKADIVTIYQYDEDRDHFVTPPTIEGDLYGPGYMRTLVEPGDAPWVIVHKLRRGWYAPHARSEQAMRSQHPDRPRSKGPRFVEREGIESSAGIPLMVHQETVGVMFVNYRAHRDFADSERLMIETFASYAAIAIRNARRASEQKVAQLETIQLIDQEISSTLDLDRVLDLIVKKSLEYLGVTDGYGMLQLFDEKTQELVVRAHHNLPPEMARLRLPINGRGTTPRVARSLKPVLIPETACEPDYVGLLPAVRSELAVPLVQKVPVIRQAPHAQEVPPIRNERLIGVLDLASCAPRAFDEAGLSFLSLLADQAVVAIQNARHVQQLEQLYKVLQTTTSSLELPEVLEQIAESTLTLLEADDAVIFPYNADTGQFVPHQVVHRGRARTDFRPGMPKPGGTAYKVLDEGILVVEDVSHPPPGLGLDGSRGLLGGISPRAFVGALLKVGEATRERILGVLYVDYQNVHRFTPAELDLLRAFADQAALAIRYAQQEEQRRKADTLQALNTFGANFAHRVTNLLGTIPPNFAELKEALEKDNKVTLRRYLSLLEADVENLDQIMQAARSLRTFQQGQRLPLDLSAIIQEAAAAFELPEEISLSLDLVPGLPMVRANKEVLLNLFTNLIDNAAQAMPQGGTLSLVSQIQADRPKGTRWIVVKVKDTGVGMTEAVRARIWEPFYGTRADGLGLGLWLARLAVQEMGGEIAVHSQVGRGTLFTIRLPAKAGAA